jgi:sugar phosphate isomerase/epimerase
MKLGLFTSVFNQYSLDEMVAQLKRYPQITALEIGTGCWPGSSHIDLDACLNDTSAAQAWKSKLNHAELSVCAFSCHGNAIHPDQAVAKHDDEIFRKTVLLAEKMGVGTVVTFSGCPGGGPDDKVPNWITAAWPPEYATALNWQWEERLIPYWKQAGKFAADHGVKIALEPHPGYAIYNPETLLKLRAATNPAIGMNLDPSHLWWQQVDIPTAITYLGDAIHHVHAKDVALNSANIARTGVVDAKSYTLMPERCWLFRSVGWGHSLLDWKKIASALRLVGYDHVLSVEHEDALASIHEGLSSAVQTLSQVMLTEAPVEAWWV